MDELENFMHDLQDQLEDYLDKKTNSESPAYSFKSKKSSTTEKELSEKECSENVVGAFEQQANIGFFDDMSYASGAVKAPMTPTSTPLLSKEATPESAGVEAGHCLTYFADDLYNEPSFEVEEEYSLPIQMYSASQIQPSSKKSESLLSMDLPLLFESDEQDYIKHALTGLAPTANPVKKASECDNKNSCLTIHGSMSKIPMETYHDADAIQWLYSDGLPLDFSPRGDNNNAAAVVTVSPSVTSGSPLICRQSRTADSKSSYALDAFDLSHQETSSKVVALFLKNDLEKLEAIQKANEHYLANTQESKAALQEATERSINDARHAAKSHLYNERPYGSFRDSYAKKVSVLNKAKSFGKLTNAFFFDQDTSLYCDYEEEAHNSSIYEDEMKCDTDRYFFDHPKISCSSPLKYEAAKDSSGELALSNSFDKAGSPVSDILDDFMSHVKSAVPPSQKVTSEASSKVTSTGKITDYFKMDDSTPLKESSEKVFSDVLNQEKKSLLVDSLVTDFFPVVKRTPSPLTDLYSLFKQQLFDAVHASSETSPLVQRPAVADEGKPVKQQLPPRLKPMSSSFSNMVHCSPSFMSATRKSDFVTRQKMVERCLLKQQQLQQKQQEKAKDHLVPSIFRPNASLIKRMSSLSPVPRLQEDDDFEILEWDETSPEAMLL